MSDDDLFKVMDSVSYLPRKPRRSTHHLPGTPGKIQVMSERALRGEALWHEKDPWYWEQANDDQDTL